MTSSSSCRCWKRAARVAASSGPPPPSSSAARASLAASSSRWCPAPRRPRNTCGRACTAPAILTRSKEHVRTRPSTRRTVVDVIGHGEAARGERRHEEVVLHLHVQAEDVEPRVQVARGFREVALAVEVDDVVQVVAEGVVDVHVAASHSWPAWVPAVHLGALRAPPGKGRASCAAMAAATSACEASVGGAPDGKPGAASAASAALASGSGASSTADATSMICRARPVVRSSAAFTRCDSTAVVRFCCDKAWRILSSFTCRSAPSGSACVASTASAVGDSTSSVAGTPEYSDGTEGPRKILPSGPSMPRTGAARGAVTGTESGEVAEAQHF
eukprot:4348907-Prymnesium_polylepis.1